MPEEMAALGGDAEAMRSSILGCVREQLCSAVMSFGVLKGILRGRGVMFGGT